MQELLIMNTYNGKILATSARMADKFFSRLKGLLGKKRLSDDEGLILYPCNMVHTIGMKIEIDVLFVSAENEIIHIEQNMPPNQTSKCIRTARYVVELPAGKVAQSKTRLGHRIFITEA